MREFESIIAILVNDIAVCYNQSSMDINELKKLAKQLGSVLILNGDKPDVIVMDYDRYELMHGSMPSSTQTFVDSDHEDHSHGSETEPRLVSDRGEVQSNSSEPVENQHLIESLNKEIQALNDEIKEKEGEVEGVLI